MKWTLRILETAEELKALEDFQAIIWPGSERDVIPSHMLQAAVQGGGLVVGAFSPNEQLVGFVFGFPGLYPTPDGPRLKHCSHMLGVHPEFRNQGIGFALKRAQWQMVRRQGVDRITWTYDPLLSANALLNIARLGAVCNTYYPDYYGEMRDELNTGLPSDRLRVDWWINSRRVYQRLSRKARARLGFHHYQAAETLLLNPVGNFWQGLPEPGPQPGELPDPTIFPLILVEIPFDFHLMRNSALDLAKNWRLHIRGLFPALFEAGYLITDFVTQTAPISRSYYILSYGESTL